MNGRNVILVTADSVRADYCGFLNPAVDTTPYLTSLSAESLVYESAMAPGPRTPSSIPSIFTGELMLKPDRELRNREQRINKIKNHMGSHRSIVQEFQDNGYTTIGFTTNPWTSGATHFDRGFDHLEYMSRDSYGDIFPFNTAIGKSIYGRFGKAIEYAMDWWNSAVWFSQWPTFFDEIVDTVHGVEEPFFLWVFLLDTHNPYIVPRSDRIESSTMEMYHCILRSNSVFVEGDTDQLSSYVDGIPETTEQNVKNAYRDSIRSVDRFVETVHEEFAQYDPAIIFHSDHGEAFGEHGSYGHQPVLYSENLHVPLLFHNVGECGRVSRVISLADLPALLRGHLLDGESTTGKSDYVVSQNEQGSRLAVRNDRWNLIADESGGEPQTELYDLENDPFEERNVVGEFPDIARGFAEILREEVPDGSQEVDSETIDESIESHLESLGYM